MSGWNFAALAGRLQVTCRLKASNSVDLDVLDLSPGGCLVDLKRWKVEPGDRVLVKLPGLAFQPSYVAWVEDDRAGLAFEQAVHDAVLDHLWQAYAPGGPGKA